jgi:hypothetical protein
MTEIQLMKSATGLLVTLLLGGCATQYSALNPNPDIPAVIYSIPRAQALFVAREALQSAARGYKANYVHIDKYDSGPIRGYQVTYQSQFNRFTVVRRLYVIPVTGEATNGQQVDGFRFVIIRAHCHPFIGPQPSRDCDTPLVEALQTRLDATGAASPVTRLASLDRVYDVFSDPNFTALKP